jgi:hypothetical protein
VNSLIDSTDNVILAPFVEDPAAVKEIHGDVWHHCQAVKIAHCWSGKPAPETRHAEVKACWSIESLNVRFLCEQREPLIIASNPILHRKTLGLWQRDVCEIFVAPDLNNPYRYFEFEASPAGEWIDLGVVLTSSGRKTDWDFESGMSTTARVESGRVVICMSIPWSESIPRPSVNSEWRANVFRCVGLDERDRYLAWLPTLSPEPNFHVPEAFGRLRFM